MTKLILITTRFLDDLPKYRNRYLEKVKELGADWVCVCYDEETEVLTSDGFKKFSSLTFQDEILTLNPKTLMLEFQKPTHIYKIPYNGEMIHFKGTYTDLLVTPNHKMFVAPRTATDRKDTLRWTLISAKELAGGKWRGFHIKNKGDWRGHVPDFPIKQIKCPYCEHKITPKNPNMEKRICGYCRRVFNDRDAKKVPLSTWEDFVKVIAWYVTEGWLHKIGFRHRIDFSQIKERSYLLNLLKRLGFSPFTNRDVVAFHSKPLWDWLMDNCGSNKIVNGEKIFMKRIPKIVKELPTHYLRILVNELLKGDGSGERLLFTSSPQLLNDYVEVILKAGWSCSIINKGKFQGSIKAKKLHDNYCISINREKVDPLYRFGQGGIKITNKRFNGIVYSVTVPNHVICVKRNGKITFSGNSDPDELYSEELAENLRKLITQYDAQGYNLLPVHAVDQFDNVEWLDDLDLLKEVPGGYRETDYWKPMLIFKLYPETYYEGVGVEGRVHERIVSPVPWNSKNLPKNYYYTHKKSALRIWRNAARNLFLGGGGDNVGALNRYWVKLRQICSRLRIKTWNEFENFVVNGTDDEEFHEWLREALQAPPTNWGTETRECAKWYFALHGEQLTSEVKKLIETKPALTPEIEVENYVTSMYFKILGRHPDAEGKKYYTELILSGGLKREDLPKVLMNSDEYKAKMGITEPVGKETVLQVPVNVHIPLNEELFMRALMRNPIYWDDIKPKLDIGRFIFNQLAPGKCGEFKKWFYTNKDTITIEQLNEWIKNNTPKPDSIALCIMGYSKALPLIIESIKTIKPYVDEIHIQGDDFSEENIKTLENLGAKVHIEPWKDNFSDYKNKAISYANTEWVLICDHDEIPTEEMASHLRKIVKASNRGRSYNMVSFDVIDVWTENGEVVSENRSSSGKALLHWNVENPYYGNPHIWLKPHYYPWKVVHVPLAYRHIKEKSSILPNSVRNVFLGGGGDNVREGNPLWVKLRNLTRELGIETWKQFHQYLKQGNIDRRILEILREMAEMPWKDDELKDPLKYYYQLHPEEKRGVEK